MLACALQQLYVSSPTSSGEHVMQRKRQRNRFSHGRLRTTKPEALTKKGSGKKRAPIKSTKLKCKLQNQTATNQVSVTLPFCLKIRCHSQGHLAHVGRPEPTVRKIIDRRNGPGHGGVRTLLKKQSLISIARNNGGGNFHFFSVQPLCGCFHYNPPPAGGDKWRPPTPTCHRPLLHNPWAKLFPTADINHWSTEWIHDRLNKLLGWW